MRPETCSERAFFESSLPTGAALVSCAADTAALCLAANARASALVRHKGRCWQSHTPIANSFAPGWRARTSLCAGRVHGVVTAQIRQQVERFADGAAPRLHA